MDNWILIGFAIFIAFDLLLIGWIWHRRRRPVLSSADRRIIAERWAAIQQAGDAHAVIEADKLLDFALGKYDFTGSLGDKLRQAGARFSDQNAVWAAHKLRNQIAHDIDSRPSEQDIVQALQRFRRALTDLRAL